ncbi:MAG: flagellar motor switch protein FliN [Magnetococcales bacterium]|nr:flagellar motor switch protein FliN [Magnetococcales bacterium]MBF0148543.1 flagellar motor switch protein FliN [Magnetococcales bacterium]MBF0172664.1 flagellar motor switch protein FliN [Magnetococcales bacterium]MBF0346489.1 flagellar motor switch protein FliN [Magnetococcales bacterium]MBF0629763.1 flagellar motor switch protein FliN [Magnetococcales bacterium]
MEDNEADNLDFDMPPLAGIDNMSVSHGLPKNLELLMDVPLNVSVRLGGVKMQIRDLLKLNKGALIELEKEADDPLEIHVNDRLLAYGEVVMIKDKLGIRITDIVSLNERLENLRG